MAKGDGIGLIERGTSYFIGIFLKISYYFLSLFIWKIFEVFFVLFWIYFYTVGGTFIYNVLDANGLQGLCENFLTYFSIYDFLSLL